VASAWIRDWPSFFEILGEMMDLESFSNYEVETHFEVTAELKTFWKMCFKIIFRIGV
jgi:hypothetical protein